MNYSERFKGAMVYLTSGNTVFVPRKSRISIIDGSSNFSEAYCTLASEEDGVFVFRNDSVEAIAPVPEKTEN